jgi:hypothetical protein
MTHTNLLAVLYKINYITQYVYGYSVLRNYRPRFSFNLLFQQHKSAQNPLSLNKKEEKFGCYYFKANKISYVPQVQKHHQTRVRSFL